MQIKIKTQELNKALNDINKFQTNAIADVFKNNHFRAKADKLTITAIYGSTIIKKIIPCEAAEEGNFATNPKLLLSLIKNIDEEYVEISEAGNQIQILNGWNTTKINCINPEEYPILKIPEDEENSINIETEQFKKSIKNTTFAASQENQKFKGTELIFNNNTVDIIATDTHILARTTIQTQNNQGCMRAIIPTDILNNLQSVQIKNKTVNLSIYKNQLTIKYDDTVISTSIIMGNFPNTDIFFNRDQYITKMKLRTSEINKALERVQVLAGKYKILTLNINKDEKNMFLNTKSDLGLAAEAIQIQEIEGENLNINLNITYLVDVCKKITKDEFIIEMKTAVTPMLIHEKNSDSKYIITPMRVA